MSKHKHFHNIKTPAQMLQHSRRNSIGPLYHWEPKKKELPGATNTEQLKKTPQNPN